ncbi:MAG: hypothetical protein ALAOOOJD_04372 [bacterium]|nr:hypothetical protein [bacterium]
MRNYIFLLLSLETFLSTSFAQSRSSYIPITIPTRDHKNLAADLYALDTTTALPVILIQTPYNKNFYRTRVGVPEAGGSAFPYDSLHYNYVVLDWRGRFGSRDADVPGYDRGLDGYDAVEWIAQQKWSNGKIGTWGGSALGQIQFQTARQHPPHLVCSVPMIKDFKTKYSDYYYGGVFRKEHVESLAKLGFLTVQTILDHPANDLVWRVVENNSNYPDDIAVPMLLISGWFDHFPDDVIRAFADLRAQSAAPVRAQHRLIMGPWLHTAVGKAQQGQLTYPHAAGIPDSLTLRFFDYYLRDIRNGQDRDPIVRYYQMGVNEWRTTNDWSAVRHSTLKLYLQAGGRLVPTQPPDNAPPDSFHYDPRDPSPAVGGSRFNPFNPNLPVGPQDLRQTVESRTDVLIYSTPVLDQDLVIDGAIKVSLLVASNRQDTDFAVRLCDVYPDGRSLLMTQGIRRMRFRNSYTNEELMQPRQIYPVTIELQNLAITFLPGHRLRLVISSSDYPHFDINLNNGGALYAPGDTLLATNYIYHEANYPSFISLPTPFVTNVQAQPPTLPEGFRVEQNFPNPFDASKTFGPPFTTIAFHLEKNTRIKLTIINLIGQTVRTLSEETLAAGNHLKQWDGRNDAGERVAAGPYLLRLENGKHVQLKRILLVK